MGVEVRQVTSRGISEVVAVVLVIPTRLAHLFIIDCVIHLFLLLFCVSDIVVLLIVLVCVLLLPLIGFVEIVLRCIEDALVEALATHRFIIF